MMDRVDDGLRCAMYLVYVCGKITSGVLLWDKLGRCDTRTCHLVLGDEILCVDT